VIPAGTETNLPGSQIPDFASKLKGTPLRKAKGKYPRLAQNPLKKIE
jgi:hypothetical protein